jgi:hypothetical protein
MTTKDGFTSIPIMNDALLSSPDTRAVFAVRLHCALIDIGFIYLKYTPVADALLNEGIMYLPPSWSRRWKAWRGSARYRGAINGSLESRSICVFGVHLRCVCSPACLPRAREWRGKRVEN